MMPVLIFGTDNQIYDNKLNLITKKCFLIVSSRTEYSVFDLVTKQRKLHKLFQTNDPKKKFDFNNPLDIFRILALICNELVDELISSSFVADNLADQFLSFVSKPVLPIIYQQVGLGISYDLVYQQRHYRRIEDPLPFGYGIIYDLTPLYKLSPDKIEFIVVNPHKKDILIPSSVKFSSNYVTGTSKLTNGSVTYLLDHVWIIPKAQYVKWGILNQQLPWIRNKITAKE
jgi:hypothetical protein